MTWVRKFDNVRARRFAQVLDRWALFSPVVIEPAPSRLADYLFSNHFEELRALDGICYIGPLEPEYTLSELYFGVVKALNLNYIAQEIAEGGAFTNGSLHSHCSVVQGMLAIMSTFGVFVVRLGSKYFVVDIFPDMGDEKSLKGLKKKYPDDWYKYACVIGDKKELIEQADLISLFKRCLTVVSVNSWREWIIKELIDVKSSWYNRSRNNILYNFSTWTDVDRIDESTVVDLEPILREAVRNLFDQDYQNRIGPIAQSLLIIILLRQVLSEFSKSVVLKLNGDEAALEPNVGSRRLVEQFEELLVGFIDAGVGRVSR